MTQGFDGTSPAFVGISSTTLTTSIPSMTYGSMNTVIAVPQHIPTAVKAHIYSYLSEHNMLAIKPWSINGTKKEPEGHNR